MELNCFAHILCITLILILGECSSLAATEENKTCTALGDASGVHKTSFSNYYFDVLCDSETAGPGWTVIQQRIGGKEDFNRTWAEYREGFGSFYGDFFLGLEKIHRLTSHKPQELFIYLNGFLWNKTARYQQFGIAGESDKYRLELGGFIGNVAVDLLRRDANQQFSTFDSDNDNDDWAKSNCAARSTGGWWYPAYCGLTSLNGRYYEDLDDWKSDGIFWRNPVKNVKMFIRPVKI